MRGKNRTSSISAPRRLSREQLADHLTLVAPEVRRIVLALRKSVLAAAPLAHEAVKFHVLSYFHPGVFLGSIGGNICMIEHRHRAARGVALSFILGADLPDPHGLLRGTGKNKRHVSIADLAAAADARLAAIVRASARAASESARMERFD